MLTGTEAPQPTAVLDEAAIRRVVCDPAIMRAQLDHLLTVSKRRHGSIRIVPIAAGAYMAMDGGFIILRFAAPDDPDVVCVDLRTRSLYLDDPAEVSRYSLAMEQLLTLVASPTDSRALIAATVKELTR